MQKWHKLGYAALAGAVLLGGAMVLPTMAANGPGSALAFPYWTISTSSSTQIRITDTSNGPKTEVDDGPFSVCVRFNWICKGEGSGATRFCNELDEHYCLTHHETLTFNVADHLSFGGSTPLCGTDGEGFLVAFAETPDGVPVSFNSLIGSAHITNADGSSDAYNAIPFVSPYAPGALLPTTDGVGGGGLRFGVLAGSAFGITAGGLPCTPIGPACFDSGDYETPPKVLQSDFQAVDPGISTDLILITLDVVSGDINTQTHVDLVWWNEEEDAFSTSRNIWCYERIPLSTIGSGRFTSSGLGTATGSLRAKTPVGGKSILGAIRETAPGLSGIRPMYATGFNPTVYFPE